ncbi:hypothetical protein T190_31960 [Sinorhizobium meliloti CCBAU 01290]|nr:hypothetical protein T190_31960 [Sinorhizobium meliloti CCBAU 01290]
MSFDGRLLTGVSVFLAVAEAGNFAKAADVLGVTPSGISRAIGRLETRMGVRLFDRTPRSVALTEEGRLFRLQALPLVAGLEEAQPPPQDRRRRSRGGCAFPSTHGLQGQFWRLSSRA